jgi:hypothetical protein
VTFLIDVDSQENLFVVYANVFEYCEDERKGDPTIKEGTI